MALLKTGEFMTLSKKGLNLLNMALSVSNPCCSGEFLRHHHGAVIAMSGKIVASGRNSSRNYSCDGFMHNCSACHAEIDALRNLYKSVSLKGKTKSEKWCLL